MTQLLIVCAAVLATTGLPAPRNTAAADSPRRAIRDLLSAAQYGDVDSFLTGLTEDSRRALLESFSQQSAQDDASTTFYRALEAQFQDRCAPQRVRCGPALVDYLATLANLEVVGETFKSSGEADLLVKTTTRDVRGRFLEKQGPLTARLESGHWRIVHPVLMYREQSRALAARLRAAVGRVTQEVQAGKYHDCREATAALATSERMVARRGSR